MPSAFTHLAFGARARSLLLSFSTGARTAWPRSIAMNNRMDDHLSTPRISSNPELSCDPVARDETRLEQRIRRHHDRGELKEAATAAIEGFGPEILGFLKAGS